MVRRTNPRTKGQMIYQELKKLEGKTAIYHEGGNVGRVQVVQVRQAIFAGAPFVQVDLKAIGILDGSRMFKPIKPGTEWTAEANENYSSMCSWYLEDDK